MPTVRIRTYNRIKAERNGKKHGWKLALLYWLIEIRSRVKVWDNKKEWLINPSVGEDLVYSDCLYTKDKCKTWYYLAVHTEIQFSDTYGGLSFSATTIDKTACCRLKKIMYSHEEERWDTVEIEVTEEQERAMFGKACEMADVNYGDIMDAGERFGYADKATFHGPNAVKYDKAGVFLSNIHPARIWGGSSSKVWCTESVCMVTNAGGITEEKYPDTQIPAQYHIRMMELSKK
jgi:hypothetical protein